jgi:chitodextrinase
MNYKQTIKFLLASSLAFGMVTGVAAPNQVSAAYISAKLAYPANFKADPSQTSVTLTWDKVVGATSYVLEKNGVKIYEGAAVSFKNTNLTTSTEYSYTVYAKDASGMSPGVTLKTKTLAIPTPAAPANFKGNASYTSVSLTWDSVAYATTYQLNRNGVKIYEGSAKTFTDNSLTSGTSYTYTVSAKNSSGASSNSTVTVKTIGVPATPSGLKVEPSYTSVAIYWNKSDRATSYEVKRDGVKVYDGTDLKFSDSNLTSDKTYTYTVVAKNPAGSTSATISAKTIGKPSAVSGIKVTPLFNGATLSWAKVTHATSYEVQRDGVKIYEGTSTSFEDKNMKVNTPYIYTFIAKNPVGSSTAVNIATKTLGVSDAPTGLKATPSTNKVSLSWNASTNATSYRVERDGVKVYEGTKLSFTDENVNPNTNYTYTVKAVNPAGVSSAASVSTKTLQIPKPSKPVLLSSDATNTKVTLDWKFDSSVDTYQVLRNGKVVYTGTKSEFIDTTVKADTTYSYEIYAMNKGGYSSALVVNKRTLTEKQYLINTIDSTYTGSSIVNYLIAAKYDSSFSSREKLAAKLGISGYTGTASQNLEMLRILRSDGK